MGKKKNKKVIRPWCWYCERDFEDEKVLIQHQKAKHFKCPHCNKKLNTAGGMVVHVAQVHKETIDTVPNAIKGRESVDVEIFGMEGIPQQDMMAHVQALESGQPSKKIKLDEPSPVELTSEEIKKQLAQHQAMMQGNSQGSQAYTFTPGFPAQQSMPSLMPHQYSQFYQRPAPSFPQSGPFRSTVLPGQALPTVPGQPWRPAGPVGAPPLYGSVPYGSQVPSSNNLQSSVFPNRPINTMLPANTIYPQVSSPAYAPYSNGPSASSVSTSTATSSVVEGGIQFDDSNNQSSTQNAQKSTSKVVLIYSDNEISMEEKRAELEKYRYNEEQFK
ncbi:11868_t:CDS:2 [Acaulospora morrowiae]|uniref:11868_t:CDS:1 n=1 Tax=Acaulospora morrowiae TaxID=94023 RepID=A0A9N9IGT9_9GLOM|nr:11868_t:CDS:2 [Acaulospora morrowiae]